MERPKCQDCDEPGDLIDNDYNEPYCFSCWAQYPAGERGGCVYWHDIERLEARDRNDDA